MRAILNWLRDWRRGYSDSDVEEATRIYNAATDPSYYDMMTPRQKQALLDAFWGFRVR